MARYFFDVINGHGLERDAVGLELQSTDDVRTEVGRILGDITRDEISDEAELMIEVNVRDDSDFLIYEGRLQFKSQFHD